MVGTVAPVVDDHVELGVGRGLRERLQITEAALVGHERLDAVVVEVRALVHVDSVDPRVGKVVVPHLQRGAAGVPSPHDPCIPAVAGHAQTDLQNLQRGRAVAFQVGFVHVGVVVPIPSGRRPDGAFVASVRVRQLGQRGSGHRRILNLQVRTSTLNIEYWKLNMRAVANARNFRPSGAHNPSVAGTVRHATPSRSSR